MPDKIFDQMALPINYQTRYYTKPDQIAGLLGEDLDFRQQESGYASHQIHSFPAKFPPQLPRKFIETLTLPGEVVLDPMQGSGTTTLEAALTGRKGVGFDIDPLALLISKVKTTSIDPEHALASGREVTRKAQARLEMHPEALESALREWWETETKKFIDQMYRYYSEMKRVLREMYRVLKPGKTSIVVVGTSIMRGRDTETQNCLAEIGKEAGFIVPEIGVRNLDRDKRMMPAGEKIDLGSQIQQRMHQEYVIGFYKPIIGNRA